MPTAKKASTPEYEAFANALAKKHPKVEPSAMFGMPCLKLAGKAFAGSFDGGVVFKLDEDAREGALALKGAKLFDPSGKGRPMKEWVVVPRAQKKLWASLGAKAMHYVESA